NSQSFEASTFLLMDSVWAPLPSVSDSARNKAITAISNAIFLFEPEACSAFSACSMLSCALMILSLVNSRDPAPRLTEQYGQRKGLARGVNGVTRLCQPRGCALR